MAITRTDGTTPIKRGPAPDLVTVYDSLGVEFEKFPIDARECVESGRFFYDKPSDEDIVAAAQTIEAMAGNDEPTEQPESATSDIHQMTKAQLLEHGKSLDLPVSAAMNKADILAAIEGVDKS